ncbi:MAG: Asp-tRNA(Asn)/Glu-tRNA(Gln) amidotransferase subunit GatB, partial [bacterium]|nr:Asp-tRNA(Asn)/Glu-tRNA(Gln) amidotransferase subunit GatB [bacterium]
KGYQISQYEHPLITGGSLAGIAITRVHLEEDTARSTHFGSEAVDPERSERTEGRSLVDFNRAGIPLMELVTEPVIPDAETAGRFARELQLLLRTLGAGEANLEKGEMRIEANVSVSNTGAQSADYVEVKNINSFRSVERAIAYEIMRQTALLEKGERVVKATRGWDEAKQETFHQRFKEGGADYRYFPEPDLPKLFLSEMPEFSLDTLQASLPELPWERRERYVRMYALKESDTAYLCATLERASFFDSVADNLSDDAELLPLAANYIVSDLTGIYAKRGRESYAELDPVSFSKLIRLVASQDLSSRGAKDALAILVEEGGDPEQIAKARGLFQIHDSSALAAQVDAVLSREEKAVREYKSGKLSALQYLIGKAMKESGGAGNPDILRRLIIQAVGSRQ